MTGWALVVQSLYWLVLVDAVLVMVVCTLGLAWTAIYAAYAVRRAWQLLRTGHRPSAEPSAAPRHRVRPEGRPW